MMTGRNFFIRAHLLLNTFKYESLVTMVEVEGTIGKTEITAGKAITDSLETKNVVIRSDSQLRLYTTKVLTENYSLRGARYISAMIIDSKARDAEERLLNTINNFRDEGVSVRGIDVTSESLNQIAQANIMIQNAKRGHGKALDANDQPPPRILSDGTDDTGRTQHAETVEEPEEKYNATMNDQADNTSQHSPDPQSDTKECPMCAETVKAKAKICRFCNYRFE